MENVSVIMITVIEKKNIQKSKIDILILHTKNGVTAGWSIGNRCLT